MSVALWSLLLGVLLITMVLAGTVLARLLLSSARGYLVLGFALGPAGLGVIRLHPLEHAEILLWSAELALLISLFTVGLKMGAVPLLDRRWLLPVRLAFIAMALTVGLITLVGVWGLGLSLGAAVLLGGILAPTDPVLASGVQTTLSADPELAAAFYGLTPGRQRSYVILLNGAKKSETRMARIDAARARILAGKGALER